MRSPDAAGRRGASGLAAGRLVRSPGRSILSQARVGLTSSAVALYLTEDDVQRLLPMGACVDVVEAAFRQWAEGRADNRPRARAVVRGALLHSLSAGSEVWERLAAKVYATSREGARFLVLL